MVVLPEGTGREHQGGGGEDDAQRGGDLAHNRRGGGAWRDGHVRAFLLLLLPLLHFRLGGY